MQFAVYNKVENCEKTNDHFNKGNQFISPIEKSYDEALSSDKTIINDRKLTLCSVGNC